MRSLLVAVAIVFVFSYSVSAATVDFTDSLFAPATNQHSFSTSVDGIGLTLTAMPNQAKLYWDGLDGFGVKYFYERDEIESPEMLKVSFAGPVYLSKIFITDLFYENGYYERGYYSLNGGSWVSFSADPNQANGALTLSFDTPLLVDFISFTAPGIVWGLPPQFHEFSVAGMEVAPVPIPAAVWMMASGIVGLIVLRRRC